MKHLLVLVGILGIGVMTSCKNQDAASAENTPEGTMASGAPQTNAPANAPAPHPNAAPTVTTTPAGAALGVDPGASQAMSGYGAGAGSVGQAAKGMARDKIGQAQSNQSANMGQMSGESGN